MFFEEVELAMCSEPGRHFYTFFLSLYLHIRVMEWYSVSASTLDQNISIDFFKIGIKAAICKFINY